jgi:hypothetical protein
MTAAVLLQAPGGRCWAAGRHEGSMISPDKLLMYFVVMVVLIHESTHKVNGVCRQPNCCCFFVCKCGLVCARTRILQEDTAGIAGCF